LESLGENILVLVVWCSLVYINSFILLTEDTAVLGLD